MNVEEIFKIGYENYRNFVNPLIVNRTKLSGEPVKIMSTKQGRLVDMIGMEFEDFHGTQAFGHRNEYISSQVGEYLKTSIPSWFPSRVSPFTGVFAQRLCEKTGYNIAWFGMSGSDVVEASMKLGRALTRKKKILSLTGAYHGCNWGSTALMDEGPFRDPFAPHLPGCEKILHNDLASLREAFLGDDVAAVIVEPIQIEGGVRDLSDAFIAELCNLTEQKKALLVADEIQTGLGRTGQFLLSSTWPRKPDCVLLGKSLGGGLVPTSAMLTSRNLFIDAYGLQFESGESHNSTYSFNTLGAVAGLATLDLLTDELIMEIKTKGDYFRDTLRSEIGDISLVKDIRGKGLMTGIELEDLSNPLLSFKHYGFPGFDDRASTGALVAMRMVKHGFCLFICGHDWKTLRLQPRYMIPREELNRFAQCLREELMFLSKVN